MDGIAVVGLLVVASAVALGGAKGLLLLVFRFMAGPGVPAVTIHWRPLLFIVALFWFWYLTPTLAAHVVESQVIARVMLLLAP